VELINWCSLAGSEINKMLSYTFLNNNAPGSNFKIITTCFKCPHLVLLKLNKNKKKVSVYLTNTVHYQVHRVFLVTLYIDINYSFEGRNSEVGTATVRGSSPIGGAKFSALVQTITGGHTLPCTGGANCMLC
jgi:hypothetical protein